ncbi:cyclin-B1-2-like isoform X1 [Hordeum vulgare subsp. vulgare]|uniref:cyclin-B1-2-like isoform X1 n=1 Tax=Hordeum vulgare subsp. vulgare TaxID=112509 RepID=UPI001D1A4D15|nr:cyclin-B1-2-like isoform X1 [Hordeum vulgare subsp. vulgare]
MASLMTKKEIGQTHDVLRFGVNDSVRGDLAPPHPVQATIHKETKFWDEKRRFGTEAIYGSAFNIRKDLDAQILSRHTAIRTDWDCRRFQRPPGALPSSMLGYEAMTGSLDDFGFEDYLNLPQDSDSLRIPDMHHGMEVRLGLSKGPVCPSFN